MFQISGYRKLFINYRKSYKYLPMMADMCMCCFRVRLVERGAPQSLPLMESGKVRCSIPVVCEVLVKGILTVCLNYSLFF